MSFPQRLRESRVQQLKHTKSTPSKLDNTCVRCRPGLHSSDIRHIGSSTFRSKTTQIHLVNNTGALAPVGQEVIDDRTRLQFKNISAKDLNGFVLGLANLRQIELDTTTGDRVIVPGEVQDIEIPGPLPDYNNIGSDVRRWECGG